MWKRASSTQNVMGAKALSEARVPIREGVFGPHKQRTYQGSGLRGDVKSSWWAEWWQRQPVRLLISFFRRPPDRPVTGWLVAELKSSQSWLKSHSYRRYMEILVDMGRPG